MVYVDLSEAENSTQNPSDLRGAGQTFPELKKGFFRASLTDRLFSFLLDYLILTPLVSFLLLLGFKKEFTIWNENSLTAENQPLFILLACSFLISFSLLQSFFIYFWEATPGQYFLKLRTQNLQNSELNFFKIMIRQLGFWISISFLGLPWLGVLTDPIQRTFYDKLSDTRVVSLKSEQFYFNFEFEIKYWRAFLATVIVFFSFILAAVGWQHHQKIKNAVYSFQQMKSEQFFCDELKSVQLLQRLQTAIALNLVGQLSDRCVDKEADFVLWKMNNPELKSLAYYAKSITESDADHEQDYLRQACAEKENQFLGCELAAAFLNYDFNHLYSVLGSKNQEKTFLVSTFRYELGLILEQKSDEKNNFQKLKAFDTHDQVKKYLLSEILSRTLTSSQTARRSSNRALGRRPASSSDEVLAPASREDLQYAQKLIQNIQQNIPSDKP